jgi:hypothetical protein
VKPVIDDEALISALRDLETAAMKRRLIMSREGVYQPMSKGGSD